MATTKIIGKVSIIPCGTYVDGTTYTRLSVVNYQGGSYIALVDNTNIVPTNDSVWYLLTAPGRGIQQIEKIETVGLVDTYRITYTDGTYFDYTVNNGASKTSELTNDAGFITNQVNNLANYLLAVNTGAYIELSYDSEGYTVTANLKNSSNTIISTSTAQLPLGGNYVSSSYDDGVITLTKLNGTSDTVELSDLVKKSTTIAGLYLADNITTQELIEALDVYTMPEINDNFVSSSASGESIYIDNSSNLTLKDFQIKGNATQETTTGKNLLPFTTQDFTKNNVRYYVQNGSLYLNGTSTGETSSADQVFSTNFAFTLQAGTYTISHTTGITNVYVRKANDDSSLTNLGISIASRTFTLEEETALYIGFYVHNNSYNNVNIEIMLEVGSTATVYEPYTGGQPSPSPDYPQDIHIVTGDNTIVLKNKNFFELANFSALNGGSATVNGDEVTITSSNTSVTSGVTHIIDIDKNTTYCLSGNIKSGGDKSRIAVQFRENSTASWGNVTTIGTGIGTCSQSVSSGTNTQMRVLLYCWYSSVTTATSATFSNLMLEVGSTATSYIRYQAPQQVTLPLGDIELVKIGDYKDRIYKDNGKWYVVHNIIKYTFTGNETWTNNGYGTNSWNLTNVISTNYVDTELQIISNIFQGIPASERNTAGNFVIYTGSNTSAVVRNTPYEQLSDIRSATSGNYIYYYSSTPTFTEITDTTLIGQLENVLKMRTYNNITNIFAQTNNAQPYLYIDYYINNVEMIKDIQEENTKLYKSLLDQIPQVTIEGQSINVKDSSNLPIQDFVLEGNAFQPTNIMTYVCNGNEEGYYYFTYNDINYQFIMPTIEQGDLLTFNTTTLKLYKGTTEITTVTDNTGTLITLFSTPNPNYPQAIHVVTGDNTVKLIGKNLLDRTTCVENVGLTWGTGNTYANTGSLTSDFIRAISGEQLAFTYYAQVFFYNKNKDYIGHLMSDGTIGTTTGADVNTVTIPNNSEIYYMRLGFRTSKNPDINLLTANIQVEVGSTATTYEPYTTQTVTLPLGDIELAKIGVYKDRIFKAEVGNEFYDSLTNEQKATLTLGKWYVYKAIGKQIWNGTEDWTARYNSVYNHKMLFSTTCPHLQADGISTRFVAINGYTEYYPQGISFKNATDKLGLVLNDTILANYKASNLKAWLAENNTKVNYILPTPIITEITDTALIIALEAILNATTYKNVTNLFVEVVSPNEVPYLQITYKQDLDTLLDNLNARITLLE